MPTNVATYNPRPTLLHRVDARVKILLVLAFSITLFCVHTWWGIGLLALLACVAVLLARIELARSARAFLPLLIILALTLIMNSLDLSLTGFLRGCYYVLRIVLLVLASLVLTTTTSSTEITQALESFLRPLQRLGVPTRDIATIVSIALRFIPVTIDEFQQLRMAQTARGSSFNMGGLVQRVSAWTAVFIPLFVGLYRRAENLASAMDARCYGSQAATRLNEKYFTITQAALLVAGLAFCILVAVFG